MNAKITRQQVFYMRVKVMRLLPIMKDNPDYDNFRLCVNDKDIVHGLDDELEIEDDLAHKMCTDLWIETLSGKTSDEEGSVQTLTSYMNLLSSSARGFLYSISVDDNDKATGMAWMTGTMRDNFKRYG